MELKGIRVAVLVEQKYEELEVWYPVYRLREAGAETILVGPQAGHTYPSKLGYPAKAELSAAEAAADRFHAVVIPGGFSPDYVRRSEPMLKFVQDMAAQGKPIAAICHGPWVLCSVRSPDGKSVLHGKRVACFHSIRDDVRNAGGTYVDEEVCVDGNLITSRKPDDLPAFLRTLIEKLPKR